MAEDGDQEPLSQPREHVDLEMAVDALGALLRLQMLGQRQLQAHGQLSRHQHQQTGQAQGDRIAGNVTRLAEQGQDGDIDREQGIDDHPIQVVPEPVARERLPQHPERIPADPEPEAKACQKDSDPERACGDGRDDQKPPVGPQAGEPQQKYQRCQLGHCQDQAQDRHQGLAQVGVEDGLDPILEAHGDEIGSQRPEHPGEPLHVQPVQGQPLQRGRHQDRGGDLAQPEHQIAREMPVTQSGGTGDAREVAQQDPDQAHVEVGDQGHVAGGDAYRGDIPLRQEPNEDDEREGGADLADQLVRDGVDRVAEELVAQHGLTGSRAADTTARYGRYPP